MRYDRLKSILPGAGRVAVLFRGRQVKRLAVSIIGNTAKLRTAPVADGHPPDEKVDDRIDHDERAERGKRGDDVFKVIKDRSDGAEQYHQQETDALREILADEELPAIT